MRVLLSMTLIISAFLQTQPPVSAASFTGPTNLPPMTTPTYTPPPVIQIDPGPRIPVIPVIPVIPMRPDTPVPMSIMPLDLIRPIDNIPTETSRESPSVLSGIKSLNGPLPVPESSDRGEGIIIRSKEGSKFEREGFCAVKLESGSILVSVRRPSRVALVTTKFAEASFSSDSDVEITCNDEGTMRVINLSGLNQSVQIKLSDLVLPGASQRVFTIKPGHELIMGDHRLYRAEIRPSDGYARRFFKTLENGQIAISEISVESVLRNSDLLASLNQVQSNKRENRILADMSKMAAVLNYMNGSSGYEAQTKATLLVKSEVQH